MDRLNPIHWLDAQHRRTAKKFTMAAKTPAELRVWQGKARKALTRALAIEENLRVPLRPRLVSEIDRGTHIERKVIIRSTPHSDVPMYILLPKGKPGPLPCVLALHGHGYGVKAIVGISEENEYRHEPAGYQKDFAVELVKRGFLVAAPEICCFGEREVAYSLPEESPTPSTCHNVATYAMMMGMTVAGMRVWDGMRVVDYLETLPMADTTRLGVMGISGGGMHAFFSACLDERIRATVISGYFCDWRQSILTIMHCTCNFVPGLLRLGELSDFAGLIAPRPLLIESGTHDPIFPVDDVRATVRRARRAWRICAANKLFAEDYFEHGHQIHGEKAYPFLVDHLGLKGS